MDKWAGLLITREKLEVPDFLFWSPWVSPANGSDWVASLSPVFVENHEQLCSESSIQIKFSFSF